MDGAVLVVDDDRRLAERYADYLCDSYTVDVAYSGEEAIESLSDAYDVVLLDRRMPVVSGNEVLAAIEERSIDARVAMITTDSPDFDIITLGIDDYLVKPVTRQGIRDTVDRLLTIREYHDRVQRLTSKKLRRNVLEVEQPSAALEESPAFERLTSEIAALESDVECLAEKLDADALDQSV